ncbi:MAG: GPW/gp25 family protein, partial [Sutterella sp.]
DEVREILQNVRTILSTRKGSVPLDRDFGLTWEHVDKPLPVAKMLMRSEVIDAIEAYEPRAKVSSVDFEDDETSAMDGVLKPKVIVEIGEEE